MKSNDIILNKEEIRLKMLEAAKAGDTEKFFELNSSYVDALVQEKLILVEANFEEKVKEYDSSVLAARGAKQLTSNERKYYNKVIEAMKSDNPKQALANIQETLPTTVIDRVFDELKTKHPLLSKIRFIPSGGAVEITVNSNGYEEAVWGELCGEIVKELTSGFKVIKASLYKLSAFLPVCKAMLELGPEWLDDFVRQVLYEALSNGLEIGFITGTGKAMPIGMDRDVSETAAVVGGVYPQKAAIAVNDFSVDTIGNLISLIAVDGNGKPRQVTDIILVVNPFDYFSRVMPATTIQNLDGTFRNNVLPYPVEIIQSNAVPSGKAIFGLGYRYIAPVGTSSDGKIEYSDHYQFLEDQRVYLIKAYANGMPLDNNAFLYLDISNLKQSYPKFEVITAPAASANAYLAALSLGAAAISPAFTSETISYTATTANATNVINAIPADAGAEIIIVANGKAVENGSAIEWNPGENTVTITVTAADGTTTKTYTVTVTQSQTQS